MFELTEVIFGIGGIVLGTGFGYLLMGHGYFDAAKREEKARNLLKSTREESLKLVEEAKEEKLAIRENLQSESVRMEERATKAEGMLSVKESLLQKREQRNADFEKGIVYEESTVKEIRTKAREMESSAESKLLARVGMDKASLKDNLIREQTAATAEGSENKIKRFEELCKEDSIKTAKNYLSEAIYRFADSCSSHRREGDVTVPKDEIKGSVVGKGGRNIIAFEDTYGVDVVFNDEPNTISLSCFNNVQREIARQALMMLMKERNITPELIVSTKPLAEKKVDNILVAEGEKAVTALGLREVPPELVKLIGRLQFRTSYGQNVLRHCVEVGYFARALAAEIGANERIAFVAGFFHDIGKAVDQEVEGTHDALTKEILEKHKYPWEIVHAAWAHHDAIPQETVEAVIVKAADAISAGRPGARALSLEQYIQKIKELEQMALAFNGVKKAFAISAGREVRVIIDPENLSDEASQELAEKIAQKIEEKGGYPGQIKVTTIRTTKVVDYAK